MAYSGYKLIYMPDYYCATNKGYVAEHRYVAEQKLGRRLKKGEIVHHIDRNRLNNDPDNLMVFKTAADHTRYHAGGNLVKTDDGSYISTIERPKAVCEYCGRMFTLKREGQKYCCIECAKIAQRKYKKPEKKMLKQMLLDFSMSQIANIYEVPTTVLVNWCISYKLPYRLKEINKFREKEEEKKEIRLRAAEERSRQKSSDKLRKEHDA